MQPAPYSIDIPQELVELERILDQDQNMCATIDDVGAKKQDADQDQPQHKIFTQHTNKISI